MTPDLIERLKKEAGRHLGRATADGRAFTVQLMLLEAAEALAALSVEVRELREDAKRYRWLRDRPSFIGWDWWNPPVPQHVNITPEFMDEAIDKELARAMNASPDDI